jgi:hypothetical protein
MRKIQLSGKKHDGLYHCVVDDADFDVVSAISWHPLVKNTRRGPYVRAMGALRVDGKKTKTVFMHRMVFERAHGPIPHGMSVDHIDTEMCGGLDNRRSNLRIANASGQAANKAKRAGCVSRFKGVAKVSGTSKWQAVVHLYGTNHYLGCFGTEVEAAKAYDIAAVRLFGEFARLNLSHEIPVGVPA